LRSAALSGLKEYAVNENIKDGTARATARRRLIRGAFGVPVVITVASGSVVAASNLNCIQKTAFPPVYDGSTPPTTDTIIRIRIYRISGGTYVRGEDVPTPYMMRASVDFMTANQVWLFNTDTNVTVNNPIPTPNATAQPLDQWAALRFDKDGFLVGVGQAANGWAITGSCWNSFG
jgi:hypothetical protein